MEIQVKVQLLQKSILVALSTNKYNSVKAKLRVLAWQLGRIMPILCLKDDNIKFKKIYEKSQTECNTKEIFIK